MLNATGDIVRYRNGFWVVVEDHGTGMFKIMAPHQGNAKLHVKTERCEPTGLHMRKVNYKGKDVLVSRKGTLISLQSLRLLKNTTPDGRAMRAIAYQ